MLGGPPWFWQLADMRQTPSCPEPSGAARPVAGNIFAFHTMPTTEFSPPETGRWAVFKVLAINERAIIVAVLDGIWNAMPSLIDAARTHILTEHRFAATGQHAVFGLNVDWWSLSDLNEQILLGNAPVSSDEMAFATQVMSLAPGSRHSTLHAANNIAEGEWRWKHDRQAYSEEIERWQLKTAQERTAREERYRTRLRKLTWSQLLAETPFARWFPSPPFPPEEFTSEAREAIRNTCKKLEALGPKRRKADVRAILKDCVEWFNRADERAGGVIETEEREDICAVLEEMAHVARQKRLVEEIDNWRTW